MTVTRIKPSYDSIEQICAFASEVVRPPDRLTIPQAAMKHRWIENTGNYVGPYNYDRTPYLTEFLHEIQSHEFTGAVFVGPAQCAKTEGVLDWVTHTVTCDPADMMIVCPTSNAARDFSKRRLSRLYRDTKDVKTKLLAGKHGQNVFDTQFKNGMLLTLGHPSVSELSGKPIPRLWITDYDRIPENVDGEGAAYDLAKKRATTFGRFGMCVAESSPGFVVENPKWIRQTPHEAPPTKGVLALYNRGDRRRFYWSCPHCEEKFEPTFDLLDWPKDDEIDDVTKAEKAEMICPHCHESIPHGMKHKLNESGRWIKDGMKWEKDGRVTGRPYRSDIASFWLRGVCAGFASWKTLVLNYLKATEEYEKTGSEEALKTTVNTDQGDPYVLKATQAERLPEELKARAEDFGDDIDGEHVVPDGVRFLLATVDVQGGMKSRFVVHVYGIGEGLDIFHVDMFTIRKSKRIDEDGDPERLDPAAYPEDWDTLIEQVLERSYPLADGSGRRMSIKLTGCDSGGADGVTTNAYNFWRRLRDEKEGRKYHLRFQLLKGDPRQTAQRYKIDYPDSQRRDRKAGARGDVPVAFINSNTMKDTVHAMLGRTEPGGQVRFPKWAEDWLYSQLTAEARTPKGWISTSRKRNEAFDLLYYVRAMMTDKRVKAELIDWENPPGWAAPWDKNDLVFMSEKGPRFADKGRPKRRSLRELAEELA